MKEIKKRQRMRAGDVITEPGQRGNKKRLQQCWYCINRRNVSPIATKKGETERGSQSYQTVSSLLSHWLDMAKSRWLENNVLQQ